MRIRQSDIKTWQRCPLLYRFEKIDGLRGEEHSAAPFGTALHESIKYLEENGDIESAKLRFKDLWTSAEFDTFLKGTSFTSYMDKGLDILDRWWDIQQWNASKIIAREHYFEVPLGRHTLCGTVDRLEARYLGAKGGNVLCVLDYKTNTKLPTRDYLRHDVQFTAYCYATTRPEFWTGIENGEELFATYQEWPRIGEWIALTQGPKRVPADFRTERDYRRLEMVADAMEDSISMGIFIPNLSGASCEYCAFRKPCGLPSREEEGL